MQVANPIINPTNSLNNAEPKTTTNITPNPHIAGVLKKLITLRILSLLVFLFLILGNTIDYESGTKMPRTI